MTKWVIGIDPDSNKHGVAICVDGKLTELKSWQLMDLMTYLEMLPPECVTVHMENVCANNAVFSSSANRHTSKALVARSRKLGMVQQAQKELERVFEWLEIPVVKHKISSAWKNAAGKNQFEQVTGWTKRSNEDTRSAAYFGFLGVGKCNTK